MILNQLMAKRFLSIPPDMNNLQGQKGQNEMISIKSQKDTDWREVFENAPFAPARTGGRQSPEVQPLVRVQGGNA